MNFSSTSATIWRRSLFTLHNDKIVNHLKEYAYANFKCNTGRTSKTIPS